MWIFTTYEELMVNLNQNKKIIQQEQVRKTDIRHYSCACGRSLRRKSLWSPSAPFLISEKTYLISEKLHKQWDIHKYFKSVFKNYILLSEFH